MVHHNTLHYTLHHTITHYYQHHKHHVTRDTGELALAWGERGRLRAAACKAATQTAITIAACTHSPRRTGRHRSMMSDVM